MTAPEFRPATTLDEANARLQAAEAALAKARKRMRRMVYHGTPAEGEALRKKMAATKGIPAEEVMAKLWAEVAKHDDQH